MLHSGDDEKRSSRKKNEAEKPTDTKQSARMPTQKAGRSRKEMKRRRGRYDRPRSTRGEGRGAAPGERGGGGEGGVAVCGPPSTGKGFLLYNACLPHAMSAGMW